MFHACEPSLLYTSIKVRKVWVLNCTCGCRIVVVPMLGLFGATAESFTKDGV
jgi:hypothetical protein